MIPIQLGKVYNYKDAEYIPTYVVQHKRRFLWWSWWEDIIVYRSCHGEYYSRSVKEFNKRFKLGEVPRAKGIITIKKEYSQEELDRIKKQFYDNIRSCKIKKRYEVDATFLDKSKDEKIVFPKKYRAKMAEFLEEKGEKIVVPRHIKEVFNSGPFAKYHEMGCDIAIPGNDKTIKVPIRENLPNVKSCVKPAPATEIKVTVDNIHNYSDVHASIALAVAELTNRCNEETVLFTPKDKEHIKNIKEDITNGNKHKY